MGGAVVAGKAGAIQAKEDRKILQADVVDDLVDGSLQEGGVDGTNGAEAARGHSRGEQDRMLLGDAHIKVAGGMGWPEEIEAGTVGHGSGDGHDARILCGHVRERVRKNLRVSG